MESLVNNPCCGEQIQAELSTHCEQCGPAIGTPEEYTVLGSDVKALYPSITSENTGKIIRRRIENSTLEFEGFCWKRGLAYIDMNKKLTTDHVTPQYGATNLQFLVNNTPYGNGSSAFIF